MTVWADLGAAPAWIDSNSYDEGDLVLGVDTGVPYVWRATSDFFSDVTEPAWDHTAGIMADSTGFWELVEAWVGSNSYVSSDVTQPTTGNGHAYRALGSGDSGASEPSPWETDGSDTDDGGTGGSNGELIPDDGSDNDAGTGGPAAGVASRYVYQVWEDPLVDMDAAPIGNFTMGRDRQFRRTENNTGDGKLTINRRLEQADWLQKGRIVTVHRESIDNQPVHGFILEKMTRVTITPEGAGAELVTWEGRGVLALLENAIVWYRSVLPNADELGALPQDDRDGMWHWLHKRAIAMLTRLLEEARARGDFYGGGRQDSPIPNIYWTFGRYKDSAGNDVDNEDADAYKLPVGDNLLNDVLPKFISIGLLIDAMPVVNADGHLRVRLDSWVASPGIDTGIEWDRDHGILEVSDETDEQPAGSTVALVQGDTSKSGSDTGAYKYRIATGDPGFRAAHGRKEVFVPYGATPTSALLDRAGNRVLKQSQRKHATPRTFQVLEAEGQRAFIDYDVWDTATGLGLTDDISEILMVENEVGIFMPAVVIGDDDPVGIVAMTVDPCACSTEPGGST